MLFKRLTNLLYIITYITSAVLPNVHAAEIKIGQLPLGAASASGVTDALPYTHTATATTQKLYLSDIKNIPTLAAALASKQSTGNFIESLSGDVVATGPGNVAATIQPLAVTNAKVATGIARSKLAFGSSSYAVMNNQSGELIEVAQLPGSAGGTGASNAGALTYGANPLTLTTVGSTSVTLPTTGTLATLAGSEAFTNKSISGSVNTLTNVPNSATTATSVNTVSTIVARDSSGNFSAGTVSAALTGTASGNTTYTANNHGVVLSGSANTMAVVAPNASTTAVLTSNGASSDPSWQEPASVPTSSYELSNLGLSGAVGTNAFTVTLVQAGGTTPSTGSAAVKIGFKSSTAATGTYTQVSTTATRTITIPASTTMGTASGLAAFIYVYAINNNGTAILALSQTAYADNSVQTIVGGGTGTTTATIAASVTSSSAIYAGSVSGSFTVRQLGRFTITEATAGTWATAPADLTLDSFNPNQGIYLRGINASGTIDNTMRATQFGSVTANGLAMASGIVTVQYPGLYFVSYTVDLACAATALNGLVQYQFRKNGSGDVTYANYRYQGVNISSLNLPLLNYVGRLVPGDTIQAMLKNDCTTPTYAAGDEGDQFLMYKIAD